MIADKLYMKGHAKFRAILLNVLLETQKMDSMLLCTFVGLDMITSAALVTTSVPEPTETPMSV